MSNILDSVKDIILSNIHPRLLAEFNSYTDTKQLPVFRDGMNNQYIIHGNMFGYIDNSHDLFPIVENDKELKLEWSNFVVKYSNNILYRYSITSFISKHTNEIKYAVIRDFCHENNLSLEENYMGCFTYHTFDSFQELESFISNDINYNRCLINLHTDLSNKLNIDLDVDIFDTYIRRFTNNVSKYL